MRESEERERNIDRKRKPEPWALRQARAKMFSITPKNVESRNRCCYGVNGYCIIVDDRKESSQRQRRYLYNKSNYVNAIGHLEFSCTSTQSSDSDEESSSVLADSDAPMVSPSLRSMVSS